MYVMAGHGTVMVGTSHSDLVTQHSKDLVLVLVVSRRDKAQNTREAKKRNFFDEIAHCRDHYLVFQKQYVVKFSRYRYSIPYCGTWYVINLELADC